MLKWLAKSSGKSEGMKLDSQSGSVVSPLNKHMTFGSKATIVNNES